MRKKIFMAWLLLPAMIWTVADGLFGFTEKPGACFVVPELRGGAEDSLSFPDWAIRKTAYRYHAETEAGTVLEQSPAAGTTVRSSPRRPAVITLTVSLGPKELRVPDVIGRDVREAEALLREHGLRATVRRVAGGKADRVAEMSPAAGGRASEGDEVTLTVFSGERPTVLSVPDLSGLSRAQALMELYRAGLGAESVEEEATDAPAGTVIRQYPPAHSMVDEGARIRITVSKGIAPITTATERTAYVSRSRTCYEIQRRTLHRSP